MKLFKSDLLELFSEKELLIACKHADMEILLEPMKDDPKRYEKYVKKLGRLDKKSLVVKNMLPQIARDLYLKGDERYCSALSSALNSLKTIFETACSACDEIDISQIVQYDEEKLIYLYKVISDNSLEGLPFELYIIFLKLQGLSLDEDEMVVLDRDISRMIEQKEIQNEYKRETDRLLKKQEKEILAQQEQEKERIIKEKKKLSKENVELKSVVDKLNQQIIDYKQKEESEHKKILAKWDSEAAKEYERKCKEQEQELSRIYREKLVEINNKIQEENDVKEKQLATELENIRIKNSDEQQRLSNEITALENQKNMLQDNNDLLYQELVKMQEDLKRYKNIEKEYYENIEQRVYEQKLDDAFIKRFQLGVNTGSQSVTGTPRTQSIEDIYECKESIDISETIECEPAETIDDFENDLRSNIELYFENAIEISATCVAALLCQKAFIMDKSIALILAKCISSITGADLPYCIKIHDAVSANMAEIINKINTQDNKTILIEGVLNKYDEELFTAICSECKDRCLIFTISDIDNLGLFPKTIYNYAIVVDAERYYTYEASEKLVTAENNTNLLIDEMDLSKCKTYYDRVFRKLVSKRIINKKLSIDFSKILYVYYMIIQSEQMGEVMSTSILKCCKLDTDQNAESMLVKAGIKR